MARPTKWSRAMEEKALDYIRNYRDYGDMIPSVVGMAVHLGVDQDTLYNWAEQGRGKFFGIMKECLDNQQRVLVNGGLSSEFNSTITKLILGKHGYHDKVDSSLSGPGGGPIETKAHPIEVQPVRTVEKNTD